MIARRSLKDRTGYWKGVSVYVGRPTPLGNPFVAGLDGSLEIVLNKYKNWLDGLPKTHDANILLDRLSQIVIAGYDLNLLCWCSIDSSCHVDIIISKLNDRN